MKNIIGLGIALSISLTAFGWGQTGHRVIGKIAENHLSKKAKEALRTIMGHESLAEASTWMDEIRSDNKYDHTHPWHYMSVPEGQTYATCEKNSKGDIFEAIGRMQEIIKNQNSTQVEKKHAIRMLTHLVGDIHQPLHVGNGQDRGGNSVKIKWFFDDSNLHRIWDSEIIDEKKMSYTEIALMVDHPVDEIEKSTLCSTDLNVWVSEAIALRKQVYNYGTKDYVSYEYMYQNWGTVKQQLYKGGIRLAQILNEIYD